MRPASLRLRLLLASAASVIFTVVLVGIALAALFSNHVERQLRADLEAQMNRLVALVDAELSPPAPIQDLPDPRFSLPYGGLYWQIRDLDTGEITRSRSIWDTVLVYDGPFDMQGAAPADAELTGPDGSDAMATVRRLEFERADAPPRRLEIIIAESTEALDKANADFQNDIILTLAFLVAALLLAGWVQVHLGLAPLSVIQRGINAVRTGATKTLEGRFPQEVTPLVSEVNELLRAQETSITFARARADDLAHGLKTSLTILNAEAQALRDGGHELAATRIEELTAEMAATIDHQLRLSRLRHRSRSQRYATPVSAAVRKVVAALQKTPQGQALTWDLSLHDDAEADLARPDLTELLGVITENAAKWAKSRVAISERMSGDEIRLVIEDDGPGLPLAEIEQLGTRGKRLDETRSGSGIGLSIAREITSLNDGGLDFSRSLLGGLRVIITLRLATAPAALTPAL